MAGIQGMRRRTIDERKKGEKEKDQGHSGQGKEYRLHFERNGKSQEDSMQRNDMI